MKINAAEENFELMDMLGQRVLFTNMRVDRSTVPDGIYAYDVRHDDDCTGEICEIKPVVIVNHWGTIICKEPIEMDEFWHSKFVDKSDYTYLGDSVTLDEFMNTDYSEEEISEEFNNISPTLGG